MTNSHDNAEVNGAPLSPELDSAPDASVSSNANVTGEYCEASNVTSNTVPIPASGTADASYHSAYQNQNHGGVYAPYEERPQKKHTVRNVVLIVLAVILVLFMGGALTLCASCALVGSAVDDASSDVVDSLFSSSSVSTSGPTIALIHIEGTISGESTSACGPETFYDSLEAAENDPNVKAIVLRVDSGGGSAGASEEMSAYVKDCTKPVVVSMSDSAASGAYMISSQSDYIFALEGTTTGSIGVISTVYNIEGLLEKLGIEVENITSGENKSAGSIYESLTSEQRAALQAEINAVNENFVRLVAEGRGLDYDVVNALADGSTFMGQAALEAGLIDEIGTLQDAIKKAAELGSAGENYDTVSFDSSQSISLSSLFTQTNQETSAQSQVTLNAEADDEFLLLKL